MGTPRSDEGCVVGSRSKRRVFAQDDYDDGELGGAMPGGSLGTHSFALTTSCSDAPEVVVMGSGIPNQVVQRI